jgi:hypothetical protein
MRNAKQNAIQSKAENQTNDLRGMQEAVHGAFQFKIL